MSSIIEAIALESMPYGSWVEVGQDGYARPDPTYECRGGVVKRPVGGRNDAEAGERLRIETEGPIQMLGPFGMNVSVELNSGRIVGGPGAVPGLRHRR